MSKKFTRLILKSIEETEFGRFYLMKYLKIINFYKKK